MIMIISEEKLSQWQVELVCIYVQWKVYLTQSVLVSNHRQTDTAAALWYMLGEGYYIVGQHLVHDRNEILTIRHMEAVICYFGRPSRSAKKLLIVEGDASDSNYEYDILTELEVYGVFNHLSVFWFSLGVASPIVRFVVLPPPLKKIPYQFPRFFRKHKSSRVLRGN